MKSVSHLMKMGDISRLALLFLTLGSLSACGTSSATITTDDPCPCVSSVPPGVRQALDSIIPLPPIPPGKDRITIALLLVEDPSRADSWISDALRMEVMEASSVNPSMTLGPDQMLVGLATEVEWAKEIAAWSLCQRKALSTVHQERKTSTPDWMVITKGCRLTDTLVFRKPGFLGIWGDVAHFASEQFWNALGGKAVLFTWVFDERRPAPAP